MRVLIPHPDCPAGPITDATAAIGPLQQGCKAEFHLEGAIADIRLPPSADGARADDLWRTTCFEIFWQPHGDTAYREYNLSPSRQWAAYDFTDMRRDRKDAAIRSIAIECTIGRHALTLHADIPDTPRMPADVALNAVIEDKAGNIHYWALAFADGPADFHRPECRAWRLTGAS